MHVTNPAVVEHFIVVGGTTGSGRVLVRDLAKCGQTVTVVGRHRPPEADLFPNVHVELLDLSDPEAAGDAVGRSIDREGSFNHLVFYQRHRGDGDPWEGELAVTLTATKSIIEASIQHFHAGRNHAVVAVGTNASRFVLSEQAVGYHAAKAALLQMVRYYAVMLGPYGVRANVVSPDTVIKEESRHIYESTQPVAALYEAITPLGRMGTAEDVAGAVRFLCSAGASFITGQDLVVDGGLSVLGQAALARKVAGLHLKPLN